MSKKLILATLAMLGALTIVAQAVSDNLVTQESNLQRFKLFSRAT